LKGGGTFAPKGEEGAGFGGCADGSGLDGAEGCFAGVTGMPAAAASFSFFITRKPILGGTIGAVKSRTFAGRMASVPHL
jgi:hypothetical protein